MSFTAVRHIWLLCLIAPLACPAEPHDPKDSRMKVWFDDGWEEETVQLRKAISIVPDEAVAQQGMGRGVAFAAKWDVYWTGWFVSCLPAGIDVTRKGLFFRFLRGAFGTALAAAVTPETHYLPEEYFHLVASVYGKGAPMAWVFKSESHRGKGIRLVQAEHALQTALDQRHVLGRRRLILAQKFLDNQMLMHSRPFLLRVWFLVCGTDPVRLYVFKGGSVIVGTKQKEKAQQVQQGQQGSWDHLIVNLWTEDREEAVALATRMSTLEDYINQQAGPEAFDNAWRQIELQMSATVAAIVPGLRSAAEMLPGYHSHSNGFMLLGADVVFDSALRPWVVEINAPSIKVLVGNGTDSTHPCDEQRQEFVSGLLQVLLARHAAHLRGHAGTSSGGGAAAAAAAAAAEMELVRLEAEAAAANGFSVLTPLVYEALGCMAGGSNGGDPCPALQGLLDSQPLPEAEAALGPRQCSAPEENGLAQRVRQWVGRITALLPQFVWGPSAAEHRTSFLFSERDQQLMAAMAAESQ